MLRQASKTAVALILTALVVCTLGSCGGTKGGSGSIEQFKSALAKDGFTVQEGKLEVFDIAKMADMGLIPCCWGNNPSTPYMVYKLPPAPGQTAPNMVSDAPVRPENKGLWSDFKLRGDEAVVFIGNTPPAVDYFSYRSYLAGRHFPGESRFKRIFASLGDTLNNMTIKTGGSDAAFDSPTMIVTTADKGINKRVHSAAVASGFSSGIINDDIVSPEIVKMGLEAEADSFAFIHRVAFFKDKKAGDAYLAKPQGTVLRLTPKSQTEKLQPHEVPRLRVRGNGDASELDLTDDLEELRQAILKKYQGAQVTELSTSIWLPEGYYAIQKGIDVIGENRDTTYLWTDQFTLADNPNEFIIVYGVNHAATGKVTYSNFGIYGAKLINGVGAVSNHDFTGTAEEYLPDNPDAKYLYVWKVARRSNGDKQCLEIPFGVGAAGIELDQQCFIGYRAYIEAETKVGPFWSELALDRAIKFSPKTQ
jgi:hypothetical protein